MNDVSEEIFHIIIKRQATLEDCVAIIFGESVESTLIQLPADPFLCGGGIFGTLNESCRVTEKYIKKEEEKIRIRMSHPCQKMIIFLTCSIV